jgi:hypothetical protein
MELVLPDAKYKESYTEALKEAKTDTENNGSKLQKPKRR